jgi:glutathione synthase/RimK-type ligase-like ATP-grasp enzyme
MLTGNILSLIQACKELNIRSDVIDESSDFAAVYLDKPYYFIHSTTPFVSHDVARICKDKAYTYTLLHDVMSMPRTKAYLDPNFNEFKDKSPYSSIEEIRNDILKEFSFPLIVKMNAGSRRRNVYSCDSAEDVQRALERIYNKDSRNYDFLALAQEKVDIEIEMRVVVCRGEIGLVYEKFTYVEIEDQALLERIASFIKPMYRHLDLQWGGFDLALSTNGTLFVIEINSSPRFGPYIERHGNAKIVDLYKKALKPLTVNR